MLVWAGELFVVVWVAGSASSLGCVLVWVAWIVCCSYKAVIIVLVVG